MGWVIVKNLLGIYTKVYKTGSIKISLIRLNIDMTLPREHRERQENPWIFRFAGILMSFAIMASSWFLNQAWGKINKVEDSLHSLELISAANTTNKFTQSDWTTNKTIIDNERLALDRRIMRLEETNTVTKDTLIEIKQLLEKKTTPTPSQ